MSWLFRVGHPVFLLDTDNFTAGIIYGDGDITPRAVSPLLAQSNLSSTLQPPSSAAKTVQFADEPPQSYSDSELERPSSRRSASGTRRRRRSGKRSDSPASDGSEETIDLPRRFDSEGRPVRKDSVADAVEAFLLGTLGGGHDSGSRRRRNSDNYVRRDRRQNRDRDSDR
jgi:hypothetical protein